MSWSAKKLAWEGFAGVLGVAAFGASLAGLQVLFDYSLGRVLRPVWEYWTQGLGIAVMMGMLMVFRRAGWLRGVFRDPNEVRELEEKAKVLKGQREQVLKEVQSKLARE